MKRVTIGIDPGGSGGIATIYPDGLPAAYPITSEAEVLADLRALVESARVEGWHILACIEQVGGFIRGKEGAQPGSAMFRFGESFGFLRGVMSALGIPFVTARPQQWQKGLPLAGATGQDRKRLLRDIATQRFPAIKPTLATADALLIADYARRLP
jgi:hypothetical protein